MEDDWIWLVGCTALPKDFDEEGERCGSFVSR